MRPLPVPANVLKIARALGTTWEAFAKCDDQGGERSIKKARKPAKRRK
jgi:hypothetical protein